MACTCVAGTASTAAHAAVPTVSAPQPAGIGLALTDFRWAVYQTEDGKAECPHGLNEPDAARKQFDALYETQKNASLSLLQTELVQVGDVWFPDLNRDSRRFTLRQAGGKFAYGLDLDHREGPFDFISPDGTPSVDDQLYRVIGCIDDFRGPTGRFFGTVNSFVASLRFNRVLLRISGVSNPQNDPDVQVTIYRGEDPLLPDATGKSFIPGTSQTVDYRWGSRYIQNLRGRIKNSVLTTEPADIVLPRTIYDETAGELKLKAARFRLKLTSGGAQGLLVGYADIRQLYYHLMQSSYGQFLYPSLYAALSQRADAYPDPKSGANTGISSAVKVRFVRVDIEQRRARDPSTGIRQDRLHGGERANVFLRSRSGVKSGFEDYRKEPIPPDFQVVENELEGPVFANAQGKTLYEWPSRAYLHGAMGELKGSKPKCGSQKTTETAGLMTRYPAGLTLPDLNERLTCTERWPPAWASKHAKPIGKWSIVRRADGKRQWVYDGQPLYTSTEDHQKGDVLGGSKRRIGGEGGAPRKPVAPAPDVPPGFLVIATATGRMITTDTGASVYVSDADGPDQSNCRGECLKTWEPVLAPAIARRHAEWSVVERTPGVMQWAFRKKPLYLYRNDLVDHQASQLGSDVPGWHNVYTQLAPEFPKDFTVQNTSAGQVLADSRGRTIYVYRCIEDTIDQFSCDGPNDPQVYRLAICGAGSVTRCLRTFPYVIAPPGAKSPDRTWSVLSIDPQTGHLATATQARAIRVWAYRGRPVFAFSGDRKPGDINGNSWGNFQGECNGFKAFWLRNDFYRNDSTLLD
jgi:predicted lipoprotein with Yx(FWY)xxD motif